MRQARTSLLVAFPSLSTLAQTWGQILSQKREEDFVQCCIQFKGEETRSYTWSSKPVQYLDFRMNTMVDKKWPARPPRVKNRILTSPGIEPFRSAAPPAAKTAPPVNERMNGGPTYSGASTPTAMELLVE